jgi:hypothetical protein
MTGAVELQKPPGHEHDQSHPTSVNVTGYIHNSCPFPIYLTTAYCCHDCFTPTLVLRPGTNTTHLNITRPVHPNCGQTIKLSPTPDFAGDIYQIEYCVEGGVVWYNLSAIDGDPFWRVARKLEVLGRGCESIVCPAGERESTCNWPTMGDCPARTGNDVRFFLC